VRRVAFIACLLAAGLAAGCGSGSSSSSPSSSGTGANGLTATTPAATGDVSQVTWNLPAGEPTSLDWIYTWDTGSGNTVLANLCESLMRQQPDGTIVPSLAQSVSTPDATTYVYDLRSGVTFTDGKPMTAQDVVFSLNRQRDPKTAAYWSLWYANVTDISVSGPMQVTVKLKKPDALFAEMMSTPAGDVGERAYVEAHGKKYGTPAGGVMCTGPYSLASWTSGSSLTLAANDHYWDTSLQPKVKTFKFTFLTDDSTITNGLITGSIDGTWQAPLSGMASLRSSGVGTLYMNQSPFFTGMEMVSFAGALKDVRIRQAFKAVIDYQGIVQGVLRGAGAPSTTPTPVATWGYAKATFATAESKLLPAKQDLTLAKKLVAEAGAPAQPIVIAVNAGNQTDEETVASIQDSAKKAGLTVTIKSVPAASYQGLFFDAKARQGIDALMATTTADIPDPLELYIQLIPSSPYNFTGYDNPGFTAPIEQATAVSDPEQRAQLVTQAQASFTDQVQLLSLYAAYERLFMNKRITGPAVSTLGYLYYPWAATVGAP
jgi:peptide/nickel transport system substrate-binding protein